MPDFPIEDVEDAYTYYVLMLGIPESIFWDADVSFLLGVVADKSAYDGWEASERRRIQAKRERRQKQERHRRR